MTALSVTSPFPESDWDRRLDTMLQDLETGTNNNGTVQQQFSSQQQSYSFSSSQQSSSSVRSSQQQQQQKSLFSSQQVQNSAQILAPQYGDGFALNKSASTASLKDSAGGVLKDLENGLVKSSHYIQESHGKYSGPDGTREWHEVKREKDPDDFNLEMQVQHMMPSILSATNNQTKMSNNQQFQHQQLLQQQQYLQQQQQQEQLTTYKVQSNQYGGGGERMLSPDDEDERPGSRLKQNIDELDTLLYDLNNARNMSPDGGADYTVSSDNFGLDSDDYSETVGKEGHVKRTVHAFNEYSQQMSHVDVATKPPSPSPRRKAPGSPPAVKRAPTSQSQTRTQQSSSQSYRVQQNTVVQQDPSNYYQPAPGPPGSGQPFNYTTDPAPSSHSPDLSQPSYYTKYNSVKQTSKSQDVKTVPFPRQQTRSPTPQNPPKRIDELMSEFQEFDSVNKGGSPTPAMFSKSGNSTVEVTELPDGPPTKSRFEPTPVIREPSPPKPKPAAPAGPAIYYPPGAEFSKPEPFVRPVADGGSMSLEQGKGKAKGGRERKDRYEDGENKQGAAVIPICLPLCCAAPCVIL